MIRRAEAKDSAAYYRLICALENQTFDRDRFQRLYEEMLQNDMYELYIYEKDHVIGVMTLFFSNKLHHNGMTGEILELYIEKDYRSRGIGKKMVRQALESARSRGCSEMELSSNMRRRDAHRFYENAGFRKDHYNFTFPLK